MNQNECDEVPAPHVALQQHYTKARCLSSVRLSSRERERGEFLRIGGLRQVCVRVQGRPRYQPPGDVQSFEVVICSDPRE